MKKTIGRYVADGVLILALTAYAVPGASVAQAGVYFGFGAGTLKDTKAWFDDNTSQWTAFAGYDFNQHLGVQASYLKSGELVCCDNVIGKTRYTALELIGSFPLDDSSRVFLKVGEASWEFTTDAQIDPITNVSGSGVDPIYGFGYGYNFSENTGVLIEYSVLTLKGVAADLHLDDQELKTLAVGVKYNF